MRREIIVTADNSKTLLIPELNETYHSVKGAVNESQHVFIANGLAEMDRDTVRIFEMGFGTGLNALLSLSYGKNAPIYIVYDALEKYPLDYETVLPLNHPGTAGLDDLTELFKRMHTCEWDQAAAITPQFTLRKMTGDLAEQLLPPGVYDLVFFDAFAPKIQPALWETAILEKLFTALAPGGRLVTYCAQGQFKRNLKDAGFSVERRPGPPGKREMTVAFR